MGSDLLPLVLCLFSAVTVALVNVLVKRGGDVLVTRAITAMVMAMTAVPLIPFVPPPPPGTWGLLAASVGVHWFYQIGVVRALHRGDLSLVFPVMRGLGPLATAVFAAITLSEYLTPLQLAGLLVASGSILVFAIPTAPTGNGRALDRQALFWAVWTAIGVGFYSVTDAKAVRAMETPMTFIVFLFLADWVGITAIMLVHRQSRVWSSMRPHLGKGAAAGVAGSLSYGAALYAFSMTDAAMVTALRETSVVFAAAFGAWLLKEGFGRRRMAAASALAAGLVLMQAAG